MTKTPNTLTIRFGDNVVIDPTTRSIHFSSAALAAGIEIRTTFVNGSGQEFDSKLDFKALPKIESIFDGLSSLSDLKTIAGSSPAEISYVESDKHARISAGSGRIHTAWEKAPGDGLYRVLLKINADPSSILDRRIGIASRVRNQELNWFGVRLEVYETGGVKRIHIREYTGSGGNTRSLDTANADWSYDEWHWLEIDVRGRAIKGRIYREDAVAPAWQVSADTAELGAGAFGPHLFPANAAKKVDIKQILFMPQA